MNNTIFRHKSFTGKFARVHAGIRLTQNTHDYATEACNIINAEPSNFLHWLMLADKLQEDGNPAHHMIRAVYTDAYQVPEGFTGSIERSYRYYEGGSQYWDSINVSYENGVLRHNWYYSGGGAYSELDAEGIRKVLNAETHARGRYENLIVTGSLPPTGGIIEPGTTVKVVRPDGTVVNNYKTTEVVPVPLDTDWNNEHYGYQAKFNYRDHTIYAPVDHIKAVV